MKKIKLYGGFHQCGEIVINVTDKVFNKMIDNADPYGDRGGADNLCGQDLAGLLTPYQEKRLEKHFCGNKDCLCGGIYCTASKVKVEVVDAKH